MASVFAPLLLAASQFVPYAKSHIIFLYQVIFLLIVIVTGFQTFSESLKPSLPLFFQLCSFAASGFFSPIKNKFSSPDFKAGLCLALSSWTLVFSFPDCFLLSHQEVFLPLHPYHVTRAVFELTTLTAAETSLDVKAYFGSPFCTEFVYSYSETSWLPYFTSATSHRNVWRQLWITFRVICKVVHTAPSGRRDSIHPYCCGSILLPPLFRVGHMDIHNFTAGLCWVSCCSPSCAMQPIHLGFRRGICRWAIGNLTLDSVSVFYMVHLSYSLMLASWSKLSSLLCCWISGVSLDTWTSRAFTWKLFRTCFIHLSYRKLCSFVAGSTNLHYLSLDPSFIRLLLAKLGPVVSTHGVVNIVPTYGQKFNTDSIQLSYINRIYFHFMETVRHGSLQLVRKAITLIFLPLLLGVFCCGGASLAEYLVSGLNLRTRKALCVILAKSSPITRTMASNFTRLLEIYSRQVNLWLLLYRRHIWTLLKCHSEWYCGYILGRIFNFSEFSSLNIVYQALFGILSGESCGPFLVYPLDLSLQHFPDFPTKILISPWFILWIIVVCYNHRTFPFLNPLHKVVSCYSGLRRPLGFHPSFILLEHTPGVGTFTGICNTKLLNSLHKVLSCHLGLRRPFSFHLNLILEHIPEVATRNFNYSHKVVSFHLGSRRTLGLHLSFILLEHTPEFVTRNHFFLALNAARLQLGLANLILLFFPLPDILLFLQCLPAIGGRRFTGSWEEGTIRTPDGWPAQRLACAIPSRENSRNLIIPSSDAENLVICPESCYDAHKTITPEVLLSVRSSDFIDGSNSDLIDSCAGIKPIGTFSVDGAKDTFPPVKSNIQEVEYLPLAFIVSSDTCPVLVYNSGADHPEVDGSMDTFPPVKSNIQEVEHPPLAFVVSSDTCPVLVCNSGADHSEGLPNSMSSELSVPHTMCNGNADICTYRSLTGIASNGGSSSDPGACFPAFGFLPLDFSSPDFVLSSSSHRRIAMTTHVWSSDSPPDFTSPDSVLPSPPESSDERDFLAPTAHPGSGALGYWASYITPSRKLLAIWPTNFLSEQLWGHSSRRPNFVLRTSSWTPSLLGGVDPMSRFDRKDQSAARNDSPQGRNSNYMGRHPKPYRSGGNNRSSRGSLPHSQKLKLDDSSIIQLNHAARGLNSPGGELSAAAEAGTSSSTPSAAAI